MLRKGKFDAAKAYLAEHLRRLDATGADGFEGLMRDVLTELTGQSYRLAKSGPQGGSDVRAIPTNSIRIGLEAKKYGATTTLGLDALSAKVVDTASQTDPVDLWILAATREITVTDVEALAAIGRKHGITVLVWDWPPQEGFLPDLAALCTLAPVTLERHLGSSAPLSDAMEEIERHPDFLATCARLRNQLHRADIGYAAAADALRSWMKVALESKRDAGARLGGFNNLLEPGVKLAPRPALFKQLDQWFGSDSPATLVGNEGVGKTWLFLSWWWARESARNPLPLTIFVSARDIRDEDAEHLVARLLAKRAGIGGEEFWLKRLHHWRRAKADGPQILQGCSVL